MSLKRFGIFSGIIVGILMITTIILSCIKVDNGFKFDVPSKIIVYNKTAIGQTLTLDETPSKFNKVKELYDKSTNLSIFDYMLKGKSLTAKPSQDLYDAPNWTESNLSKYYCVEFIFEEKQSVVVRVDGSTRVIEFYSFIMKVDKSIVSETVSIYFSVDKDTSYGRCKNPILINAKQNKLLKYIKSM